MKPDEFREMLAVRSETDLLDLCLRSDEVPFICEDDAGWAAFRQELSAGVEGLGAADVRIVGSGRHGFSMNPKNKL